MPHKTSIAKHPERVVIAFALANGVTGRAVAAKFKYSEATVSKYKSRLLRDRPEYVAGLRRNKPDIFDLGRLFAASLESAAKTAKANL